VDWRSKGKGGLNDSSPMRNGMELNRTGQLSALWKARKGERTDSGWELP